MMLTSNWHSPPTMLLCFTTALMGALVLVQSETTSPLCKNAKVNVSMIRFGAFEYDPTNKLVMVESEVVYKLTHNQEQADTFDLGWKTDANDNWLHQLTSNGMASWDESSTPLAPVNWSHVIQTPEASLNVLESSSTQNRTHSSASQYVFKGTSPESRSEWLANQPVSRHIALPRIATTSGERKHLIWHYDTDQTPALKVLSEAEVNEYMQKIWSNPSEANQMLNGEPKLYLWLDESIVTSDNDDNPISEHKLWIGPRAEFNPSKHHQMVFHDALPVGFVHLQSDQMLYLFSDHNESVFRLHYDVALFKDAITKAKSTVVYVQKLATMFNCKGGIETSTPGTETNDGSSQSDSSRDPNNKTGTGVSDEAYQDGSTTTEQGGSFDIGKMTLGELALILGGIALVVSLLVLVLCWCCSCGICARGIGSDNRGGRRAFDTTRRKVEKKRRVFKPAPVVVQHKKSKKSSFAAGGGGTTMVVNSVVSRAKSVATPESTLAQSDIDNDNGTGSDSHSATDQRSRSQSASKRRYASRRGQGGGGKGKGNKVAAKVKVVKVEKVKVSKRVSAARPPPPPPPPQSHAAAALYSFRDERSAFEIAPTRSLPRTQNSFSPYYTVSPNSNMGLSKGSLDESATSARSTSCMPSKWYNHHHQKPQANPPTMQVQAYGQANSIMDCLPGKVMMHQQQSPVAMHRNDDDD